MTVAQDVMTRNPVTCRQSDTIQRAVAVMKREDTGVVPIVDDSQRCVGVITDRDVCLDVVLNELDYKSVPLEQVMHTDLLTCRPGDNLQMIIDQMSRKQVKRILVVDDNQRCVGIISEADMARSLDRNQVGELAEGVYR